MREIRSPLDGILSPFAARPAAAVDAYAVQGLSPLLVADFTTPYYRKAGAVSTFDSTFTHSRAGNATMVDSDGLIKWAPHNLITYSESANNWIKFAVTVSPGAGTTPDGKSADLIYPTSTGADRCIYQGGLVRVSKTHGAVVKASGKNIFCILQEDTTGGGVWFDLSTGLKGTETAGWQGDITPLGGGWYFCEATSTSSFNQYSAMMFVDADNSTTSTVNGTDGGFIGQMRVYRSDLGGTVNNPDRGDSYVPTTSAAVYQARRNHYTYNGTSWVNSGLLLETEARTNLLYGTNTLATQTYTTTAVPHTLSFTGTGTVTLSGSSTAGPLVGTGTGENNRVNLTFTPTAAGLTLTVTGTVTNAQLEIGSTPSSYMPNPGGVGTTATRPTESLQIAAADMPWDASNVSLQMNGKITYADEGVEAQQTFARWYDDASNYITIDLDTDSTDTGEVNFQQQDGTGGTGTTTIDTYSPGILVPYNIASRNTSTAINGATDGTAGTEDTTPTALPDLSAKDFSLGYDYMGTVGLFRAWNVDIGDAGIAEASS